MLNVHSHAVHATWPSNYDNDDDDKLACSDSAAAAAGDLGGTYVAHSLQSLTAKSWQSTWA